MFNIFQKHINIVNSYCIIENIKMIRNNNINIYTNCYISSIVVTGSLDGELYHDDLDTVKTPIEYVDPGCRPVIVWLYVGSSS